jgi:NodT family efflux transporter outer membrane factor (OMF) lipoprotein
MRRCALRLATTGIAVFLAGCLATPPKYEVLAPPVPKEYRDTGLPTQPPGGQAADHTPWWAQYGSAELVRLIDLGLRNNSELRIARLQVAQARIRATQAHAGSLPLLTAPLRIATQGSGGTADTLQSSQVGLMGTYRLDIWGEQGATDEAAQLQVLRALYARDNVQRTMVGGLVSAYIGYLASGDSLALARDSEAVAQNILQSVEKRLSLGDATVEELEQQRAAVALQQANVAALENQQEDAKTLLARLTGMLVSDLNLRGEGLANLRSPVVDAGLPSSLLLQRPDIRMVEARMRAANANIELARARLLPPLDLSAQAGVSGLTIAQLLQPESFFWNAAASLAVTIFDGGRRQAEKDFAESAHEEMVETYRQTIYQAIREVESAAATLKFTQARLNAQNRSARSALASFRIATNAYELGAADLSALLQARKNYQRSADESQRTKAELLSAYATLSLALGADATAGEAVSGK